MSCSQEEFVAVVFSAAESLRGPFTLQDIAAVLETKNTRKIKEALESLCMIEVLTTTKDGWIMTSDQSDTYARTNDDNGHAKSDQLRTECTNTLSKDQHEDTKMHPGASCADATLTSPAKVTRLSFGSKEYSKELKTIECISCSVSDITEPASIVSYDCDREDVEQIESKLRKIIHFLQHNTTPIKAFEIAKKCELGTSKSAVNRYLYFLEKKGLLCLNDNKWSILDGQQKVSGTDLTIYAAELAEKKPSRRQKAKTEKSTECEYGCVKSSGNCFHLKQENHYHQTFMQVGDGSRVEYHTHGEDSKQ